MNLINRLLRQEQAKLFLYLKISILLLNAVGLYFLREDVQSIQFRVVAVSLILNLITSLLWGVLFLNKPFNEQVSRIFFAIDALIIFSMLFPALNGVSLFILIPALYLIVTGFVFSRESFTLSLVFFFSVFLIASVLFGVLNVTAEPVQTFASGFILFGIISGVSVIAGETYRQLERERNVFQKEKNQYSKSQEKLKRELSLSRQHTEILNKDVRKREIEIKNILTISGQLNLREDSKKILRSFLLTAIGQIGSSHAAILTQEKRENNFINMVVQKGLRNLDQSDVRIYLTSNLIQIFNAIREPIMVNQIPTEAIYEDEIKVLRLFQNDMICPIHIRGTFTGVMIVGGKISGADFTKEDFNLVSIISNQTAFVLEQTKLTQDYRDFYAKTIRAMLESLEAKYIFSKGHNVRTANYVNMVAKRLQMSTKEIKDLTYGSLLHDIGKIAIKDEYLLNTDTFTDRDAGLKDKILAHTIEGSKILKAAGFSKNITDLALHHHEFYNGKGFPHKIGETDLSLSSRILSVCNAYDAMTSDRPHRKALPVPVAREHLLSSSKSQFDPEIVRVFLEEIDKKQPSPNLN